MQVTYEMPVDCSEHKEEWWEQGQWAKESEANNHLNRWEQEVTGWVRKEEKESNTDHKETNYNQRCNQYNTQFVSQGFVSTKMAKNHIYW
jgi:hypothetical protein